MTDTRQPLDAAALRLLSARHGGRLDAWPDVERRDAEAVAAADRVAAALLAEEAGLDAALADLAAAPSPPLPPLLARRLERAAAGALGAAAAARPFPRLAAAAALAASLALGVGIGAWGVDAPAALAPAGLHETDLLGPDAAADVLLFEEDA